MKHSKNPLFNLRQAIEDADYTLRNKSKCPICGKPKNGFIWAGQTKETAGLCICKIQSNEQNSKSVD